MTFDCRRLRLYYATATWASRRATR
jgi:hypothetical protein